MSESNDLHIRHASGESHDLNLADLELDSSATDAEIIERAGMRLSISLKSLVIDRRPDGQIMLHPEAVYG